ncbi:hypothetical protein HCN44_003994 [Aphidius gifuensis]|uniref:RHD domain-containing protein n=1 Tax=Aphidius gifuensis TaxID=684658 RepID=A0A834XZL3_APHGI|nr:hypothetical protein HCN44_003994 [Aphidius gifuensis]
MDQFMNENNSDNMDVLNDVLAVLDADVDFNGHNDHHHHQQQQQQQQEQQQKLQQIQHYLQQQQPQQQQMLPYTFIVEQPASKAIRFRYKCEGRSAGSIPGVNSTPENKTYPTIRVIGYVGRAVVVVSLVTKDSYSGKYRAHPHNLVGKGCIEERGVCHVKISPNNNMEVSFSNLGIQCVKKKEIGTSFKTRKEIRVDPFKAGFSHKNQPIELNVVRLCFEVYLPNEKDEFKIRLEPIVSDPIYDKKAMSDLVICRLSHCCASAAGGTSVILLCEKVLKDDIQVRFFQKINDEVIWEKNAEFTTNDVHKQVAITFKTPKYDLNPDDKAVKVFVQLRRPSDGAVGEPRPFEMIPIGADDPDYLKRKRTRYSNDQTTNCLHELQNSNENSEYFHNPDPQLNTKLIFFFVNYILLKIFVNLFFFFVLETANNGMTICSVSHDSVPASGGQKIIILTEKIYKTDIEVWFYQLNDEDDVIWKAPGIFEPEDIHYQRAITLKTPAYSNLNIKEPVTIFIQLYRRSNKANSEFHEIKFVPDIETTEIRKRKRNALGNSSNFFDENSFEYCTCINCPQHAGVNTAYPAVAIDDLSQINTETINTQNYNELSKTTKANSMSNFVDNISGNDNKLVLKSLGIKNNNCAQLINVNNNFEEHQQTPGDIIENLDPSGLVEVLSESLSSVKINSDDLKLFDSIYCSKQ